MAWTPEDVDALDESFLKRVMHATFDTPEEFGGPKRAKKPKQAEKKPAVREPFLTRVKKAATRAGETIFPKEDVTLHGRIFTEAKKAEDGKEKPPFGSEFAKKVEKAGARVEKALDVTHPDHKLHFVYKWAERHAEKAKPLPPHKTVWSPQKHGAGKAPTTASGSAERAFVRTRFGSPMQQAARFRQGQTVGGTTPLPVRRPPGQTKSSR